MVSSSPASARPPDAASTHIPLTKVLTGLRQEGLTVSALVTDNEQVNKTLWELLVPKFPFLVRSPCAAHIIQLCVHGTLGLEKIEPVMIGVEHLIGQYRLKTARLKLKNRQLEDSQD